jgi:hypothetical protein
VKDVRYMQIILLQAERAWAYAMDLKQFANTESRKQVRAVFIWRFVTGMLLLRFVAGMMKHLEILIVSVSIALLLSYDKCYYYMASAR